MKLHRFWFTFLIDKISPLGYGVTAYTQDDAENILRSTVFAGRAYPVIKSVTPDIDVTTLDPNHVRPNMETPNWRGVWYPRGFHFVN